MNCLLTRQLRSRGSMSKKTGAGQGFLPRTTISSAIRDVSGTGTSSICPKFVPGRGKKEASFPRAGSVPTSPRFSHGHPHDTATNSAIFCVNAHVSNSGLNYQKNMTFVTRARAPATGASDAGARGWRKYRSRGSPLAVAVREGARETRSCAATALILMSAVGVLR